MMKANHSADINGKARVLLIEDHPIFREGLSLLIDGTADLAICGAGESIAEALSLLKTLRPNIVITDMTLADGSGLDLIKQIHELDAGMPILVLSVHNESLYAERALRAGARGYVMKSEPMSVVQTAIRSVLAGEIAISKKMTSAMMHKFVNQRSPNAFELVDSLSVREFQVFRLIAEGLSRSEIAARMQVSVKTVESHREHLKGKLGIEKGVELTRFALDWAAERL